MKCIPKLLVAVAFVAAAFTGRADTITWNGSVSSSWANPNNWTPQEVPTTNDHAIISSGNVTTAASNTFAILDWSGGTITGPLTVLTNAVLNISWNALTSWSGSLTNGGTVNVTGTGQLNLGTGPINNLPGGVIDFKANQNWAGFPVPVNFYNAGLVRKSAGTGLTQIGVSGAPLAFINTGTVEADTGTIGFVNGGLIDAGYQAASGATINFSTGIFTVGSPVISGAGTVKFTGTTLTLSNDVVAGLQLASGTLNLGPAFQGGNITNLTTVGTLLVTTNTVTGTATLGGGFTGALTVAGGGTLNWSAGSGTGPLTVQAAGVLNLGFANGTSLAGSLTNAGTVNVTGIGQFNLNGAPVNNLAGGIIDLKATANWAGSPAPANFYNAGLVRKSTGSGTAQIGVSGAAVNFFNAGTVEADTGTISFSAGGQIDANYQAASGAAITFASGSFTAVNPIISGAGAVKFTGGTLTLPTNVISSLQLLGGTLNLGPSFQGGSITNLTLTATLLATTNSVTGTATLGAGFAGALTVAGGGALNWSGGNGSGILTVLTNGVLNLSWIATTTWTGSLTNAGTVNVTATGQLNLAPGPVNNLAGGVIDFKATETWTGFPGPVNFYNSGLVRKSAGTGVDQIGFPGFVINFINTGTVEADTGTISFATGGEIDGNYLAASGATISFTTGAFTAGAPVLSGAGVIKFSGNTLTLLNNVVPGLQLLGGSLNIGPAFQGGTITNLNLPGLTLAGTNTITGTAILGGGFTGVLTVASNGVVSGLAGTSQGSLIVAGGGVASWTNSGTFTVAFTVLTNGILNLDWNVVTTSWTGSLTNAGTVNVHGSGQLNWSTGPINNLPGGLIDFKTNQVWTGFSGSPNFYNAGLVRKSGGTLITEIGYPSYPVNFFNTGTVEADIGTISFGSGGSIDGSYLAATNSVINFINGSFTKGNPVLSGTGNFQFTGTTLILSNDVIPGLQLLGGVINLGPAFQGGTITNLTLSGTTLVGTNVISGSATLRGGYTGTLTVASNGVVNSQSGTSQGSLIVTNGGTFNWSGGTIGGSINVLANGVLNISWNAITTLSGSLTNAGTVNVTASGQLDLITGPINNLAGGTIDFKTNQVWTGFPASFYNAGLVRKSGGAGITQFGVSGFPIFFTNTTGTVEADTGTLLFNAGGYSDTSAAHISISLGGAAAATNYGLISFTAPPVFNANLVASTRNGFVPLPGQKFKVLSYPASTNQFNCISGLDLGGGILLQAQFSSTGLTLLTSAYSVTAVLPQLFINTSLGGVAVTWPASFSGWTLQSATNLTSPSWITVPAACGNEAQVPVLPPAFFRLKN